MPRHRTRKGLVLRVLPALLLVALAAVGPWLAPHAIDTPVTAPYAEPGAGAPLGGDQLGRDVLTRLLAGGRELIATSLLVAVLVTAAAALLGAVGALRPAVGRVVERAADVLMLLPAVLGILLIALSWPGGGRYAVIAAAVVMGVPYAVRLVSGAAAPVAASGYIEAAAVGGERLWHLVVREVLPNLRATLLALFGLRFVAAVYIVATAGFLQVGPQPPAADWALMIRENSGGIVLNPWAVLAPSIAIGLLAMSVNLAASALVPQPGRKTVTAL
ncbi:ABC transporter permease [Streptomyces agglomeratus]|uniref:ABC transporter permease n=1 Tax=Streptomyces agglomeratus TaxID=285458 RepID=A0A1E5PIA9_9ACTN|nr:ABC transporter permease [Streptomyces agglomeratus]OEJ42691.1 ABC transporter permease [Streptomyces agglomeratus]OEJ48796.1 ABC transporter permease [Streptomyces agglomeratus]OEJ56004.1 ABC transporter permease [Streptomyces agglomeratus]OEJ63393.1 ABC transporter permease [Streptomyces agglomeratus]